MRCPFCGSQDLKVVDKRDVSDLLIRRRRECNSCNRRFTTYERIDMINLIVVKKDGRREPYNREKAKTGILLACRKLPISMDQIENILDSMEASLEEKLKSEVLSSEIGEMISNRLAGIHKVAYLRFASVYREFKDIAEFIQEAEEIRPSRDEESG